jgi:hypothetical protein
MSVCYSPTAKSLCARGKMMVSRIFTNWNRLDGWVRQLEGLRRVA